MVARRSNTNTLIPENLLTPTVGRVVTSNPSRTRVIAEAKVRPTRVMPDPSQLRAALPPDPARRTSYATGEIADLVPQCELSVGLGQTLAASVRVLPHMSFSVGPDV